MAAVGLVLFLILHVVIISQVSFCTTEQIYPGSRTVQLVRRPIPLKQSTTSFKPTTITNQNQQYRQPISSTNRNSYTRVTTIQRPATVTGHRVHSVPLHSHGQHTVVSRPISGSRNIIHATTKSPTRFQSGAVQEIVTTVNQPTATQSPKSTVVTIPPASTSISPKPNIVFITSTTPKPNIVFIAPTTTPKPNIVFIASTTTPKPNIVFIAPTTTPKPDIVFTAPTTTPKPKITFVSPSTQPPKIVVITPSTTPKPKVNFKVNGKEYVTPPQNLFKLSELSGESDSNEDYSGEEYSEELKRPETHILLNNKLGFLDDL